MQEMHNRLPRIGMSQFHDRVKIMRAIRLACLLLVSSLVISGCSGIHMGRKYASPRMESPFRPSTWLLYVPNRVLDVFDVAAAGVQVGPGLNVRVQTTRFIDICFPFNSCGPEIGLNSSWVKLEGEDDTLSLGKRYRLLTNGCYGGDSIPFPIINFNVGRIKTAPDQIDVGAHALLVGAHAGIRPLEIVDLVTGFVFIDFNRDDLNTRKREKKSDQKAPAEEK